MQQFCTQKRTHNPANKAKTHEILTSNIFEGQQIQLCLLTKLGFIIEKIQYTFIVKLLMKKYLKDYVSEKQQLKDRSNMVEML